MNRNSARRALMPEPLLTPIVPRNSALAAPVSDACSSLERRRAPQSELGTSLRSQFACNLRLLRMERGWTQADLARLSGLGRSFISQIERGHFSVTLETIGALCTALGIAPAALIQPVDQRASRAIMRR